MTPSSERLETSVLRLQPNRRAGPRLFGALRGQAPLRQPVGPRGGAARGVAPQPAGAPDPLATCCNPLQPAATRCNPLQPAATSAATPGVTPAALSSPLHPFPRPAHPSRSSPPGLPSSHALRRRRPPSSPQRRLQYHSGFEPPSTAARPRPAFAPPPSGTLLPLDHAHPPHSPHPPHPPHPLHRPHCPRPPHPLQVLAVCRSAVQLLVHLGSIDAVFLRRVLGCNELRVQTFHLAHLVLQHHMESVNGAAAVSTHGSAGALSRPAAPPLPAGVAAELTALLHEMILLLGQYTLGSAANGEILRWRWAAQAATPLSPLAPCPLPLAPCP